MVDNSLLPEQIEITAEDVEKAPPDLLRKFLLYLIEENRRLKKRIEELEAKLNHDSSNSNRPPSSDSPFKKENSDKAKTKSKTKNRKGRKGHRQQMLDPTEIRHIHPKPCSCGCDRFVGLEPYYTHQHAELPEVVLRITHFELYRGKCGACGKVNKGHSRWSFKQAMVPGSRPLSWSLRAMVQSFCS